MNKIIKILPLLLTLLMTGCGGPWFSLDQKQIIIQRNDSSSISGLIDRSDSAMIWVSTLQGIDSIERKSIHSVSVLKKFDVEPLALNGFVIGYWLPALVTYPFVSIIAAELCGIAGLLLDNVDRNDKEKFDFTDKTTNELTYTRLREYLALTPFKSKFRLAISSAYPTFRLQSHLEQRYKLAGYSEGTGAIADYDHTLNIVRSVQATYAVMPNIDLGLMFSTFSEKQPRRTLQNSEKYAYFQEDPSATGYFVVSAFRYPIGVAQRIDVSIGVGAGLAKTDYSLSATIFNINNGHFIDSANNSVHKFLPAGIIYGRLNIYTRESFMFGLSADYIATGNLELPANKELGLHSQSVSFGNSCIGLSFGWRF